MTDKELLVSLHQKQDKHHDWLKRQMRSLMTDLNRVRNLSTKNAFVAHEASRRAWKSLTLLCSEDDLAADGFKEGFKFDSKPPATAKWRTTPSLEDSDYSSSAPTIVAWVVDEEDDATSPPMASLHQDATSGPSAPSNSNIDLAAPTSSSPPRDV